MPSSALALSRPRAAASLKDWSPRPPTSYASPTLSFCSLPPPVVPPVVPPSPPQAATVRTAAHASAASLVPRRNGGLLPARAAVVRGAETGTPYVVLAPVSGRRRSQERFRYRTASERPFA